MSAIQLAFQKQSRSVLHSRQMKSIQHQSRCNAWIEDVQLASAAAPEEEEESKALCTYFPKPGNVKQKRKIPELDMEEWILSNGTRVLLKQTSFQADRILFSLPYVLVEEASSQQRTFIQVRWPLLVFVVLDWDNTL